MCTCGIFSLSTYRESITISVIIVFYLMQTKKDEKKINLIFLSFDDNPARTSDRQLPKKTKQKSCLHSDRWRIVSTRSKRACRYTSPAQFRVSPFAGRIRDPRLNAVIGRYRKVTLSSLIVKSRPARKRAFARYASAGSHGAARCGPSVHSRVSIIKFHAPDMRRLQDRLPRRGTCLFGSLYRRALSVFACRSVAAEPARKSSFHCSNKETQGEGGGARDGGDGRRSRRISRVDRDKMEQRGKTVWRRETNLPSGFGLDGEVKLGRKFYVCEVGISRVSISKFEHISPPIPPSSIGLFLIYR